MTTPGKIFVILISLVTLSISIVGILQLQQWFDPTWLISKESYLYKFIMVYHQAFPNAGYEGFVLMGDDIDYSSDFPKIISLTERLQNTSYIKNIESWPIYFTEFVSTYHDTGYLLLYLFELFVLKVVKQKF